MMGGLDDALTATAEQFGRLKAELATADVLVLQTRHANELLSSARAWAYVRAAGLLESAVRSVVGAALAEVNARHIRVADLRPSLRSLIALGALDSLRVLRDYERLWSRRCELVHAIVTDDIAVFPLDALPLDGRTIRPRHFDTMWLVFGFSGPSLPGPIHRMSLTELADLRNNLAHGLEFADTIARRKTHQEVLRSVQRAEDVAEHLLLAVQTWLDDRGYLR